MIDDQVDFFEALLMMQEKFTQVYMIDHAKSSLQGIKLLFKAQNNEKPKIVPMGDFFLKSNPGQFQFNFAPENFVKTLVNNSFSIYCCNQKFQVVG